MAADLQEQYDKIYKYCCFRVKSRETAEDLTQETFLHYYRQDGCASQGKPLAYLYTIARNLCVDHYRRRQTQPLAEETPAPDDTPAVLTRLAVAQAVQDLPPALRELVALRYGAGLSVGETAAALGLSRFAVYRQMNQALGQLKQTLREEDFDE